MCNRGLSDVITCDQCKEAETVKPEMQEMNSELFFVWISADSVSGLLIGRCEIDGFEQFKVSGQTCPRSEPKNHKGFKAKAAKPWAQMSPNSYSFGSDQQESHTQAVYLSSGQLQHNLRDVF